MLYSAHLTISVVIRCALMSHSKMKPSERETDGVAKCHIADRNCKCELNVNNRCNIREKFFEFEAGIELKSIDFSRKMRYNQSTYR